GPCWSCRTGWSCSTRARSSPRAIRARPCVLSASSTSISGGRMSWLEVRNLAVAYGDAPAVWDASLDVGEGQIVSVIGPNGAGKSTLVNTIAGLQRARSGMLRFAGVDLTTIPPHRVCRHGIALVPEGRRLFTRMSVEENLEIGGYRREARAARAATLERV